MFMECSLCARVSAIQRTRDVALILVLKKHTISLKIECYHTGRWRRGGTRAGALNAAPVGLRASQKWPRSCHHQISLTRLDGASSRPHKPG